MTDTKKYITAFIISLLLLAASIILGLAVGSVDLSFNEFLRELTQGGIIVNKIRLPRVLGAGLAGGALSCAGMLLQCITANDLCAPNIIGINAGAGFFVILILAVFPSAWGVIPTGAFLGALLTAFTVLAISYTNNRHGKSTLVLAGVAVSSVLNAAISFLSLMFPDILPSYTAFSVGGFAGLKISELYVPCAIILFAILSAQILAPRLSLLCVGDEVASSLGIRVMLLRVLSVIISSALCAAAVSFAGLLGFVGLIVPHIVRRIIGEDMRIAIPLSVTFGSSLVILSDLLGRVIFRPTELPAGIIMAFIGAPFFLFLLIKRRYSHD